MNEFVNNMFFPGRRNNITNVLALPIQDMEMDDIIFTLCVVNIYEKYQAGQTKHNNMNVINCNILL